MAFGLLSRIASCLGFGGRKKCEDDSLTQRLNAEGSLASNMSLGKAFLFACGSRVKR